MSSSASPPQTKTTPNYQLEFRRILNNVAKIGKEEDRYLRTKGFVVLARGGRNLKQLQSFCVEGQTYNHCLTARYRLQPGAAIGTLLAAHLSDIVKIGSKARDMAGDLQPAATEEAWKQIASSYTSSEISFSPSMGGVYGLEHGVLEQRTLSQLFERVFGESTLGVGERFVLFGELSEEATETNEWDSAIGVLLSVLPERVGIVLSGAPKDLRVPKDDPHFIELTLPSDEGANPDGDGQFSYKYTDSSFHADEPASEDRLGVNDYANAIARFIVHPQTKPPLTLGINGPWGKGKSSFMRLVDNALIKYAEVNRNVKRPELNGETRTQHWNDLVAKLISPSPGKSELSTEQLQDEEQKNLKAVEEFWKQMRKEAEKNVLSVTFNAWQFEDAKQTWAGLASQISERIERALPWASRQWLKLSYAWKERKNELILTLLLPLAIVCIVAGLVKWGFFAHIGIQQPQGLLGYLLPAGSVLLTIWFVSSQILKVAVPISERVLSYVRMPNYREQMGFQHRVKDDLQFLHKFLAKRRPGCRVVIYIDDLDRCSENKIMELLQAINLILASSEFFVFVGMDTEMIYRAIKSYYKETPTERSPDSYLRKIVQISFYLPETISQTRADYVNTLFSSVARMDLASHDNGPDSRPTQKSPATPQIAGLPYNLANLLKIVPIVTKEAEDTADELQAFRDYRDYLNDNPREIKRLINIHRLIKILVQKPNTSWSAERQRKLVKWLIFCDCWPHLVDDVLNEKNQTPSLDILSHLAATLAEEEKNDKGTGPTTPFYRLKEFAELTAEGSEPEADGTRQPRDVLLFKDIDAEFRLAANLSQLISKSPAVSAKSKTA